MSNDTSSPSVINIQPSARILRVLGDIEFEPWQCLAELVDNSFDDFLDIERSGIAWPDGYKVSITLPKSSTPVTEAEVVVTDTGRGMDLPTLNNAVRAGWSSNDRFSKLGLFGMGFNIATARMGRLTRVLTTRSGDTEWVGVVIDLDNIGDDFNVPVIRRPKTTASEHGTVVEIARLDPFRSGWLGRNLSKFRTTLGDVYPYLLAQKPFHLFANGVKVNPRRPCAWDSSRSVTYGRGSTAEQIPAVREFNKKLPDAKACLTCGNWEPVDRETCTECGNGQLVLKERSIRGWIGIQRYLHKTEFGIDFLRNGRKILRYDKRLFEWTDPNDPLATPELEYPIELGQGGRIIGEIHLDHVPVNYQKNAFEWSDRNWISAARFVRGEGPLLPKRAKQLGYPPNDSLLASLHRGYRRNDPGYRCLIPGNGTGPIHGTTLEWRDKFHKGEPDYQTDEKWWEAVVYHESKLASPTPSGQPSSGGSPGDVLSELGLTGAEQDNSNNGASVAEQPPAPAPKPETERERLARYRDGATRVPELSGEFGLTEFGATVNVDVHAVSKCAVKDNNGFRTPVLLARERGREYGAYIDLQHPVFKDFADEPADYLVVELANHLKTRAEHEMPLAQAVALLKERQLSDLKVDAATLAGQARELLADIREQMAEAIKENPDRAWQFLTTDERATTETNLVVEAAGVNLKDMEATGEFLLYTPLTFTPRLVEEWPEAFMDGKVFKGLYDTVKTPAGKRISVGRVASYLYDAALTAEAKIAQPAQLFRCRLSLQLLRNELAPVKAEV
ncbi:hypothetical protein S1OALGB6SA_1542 [Olavius algarvensis spirochete endosymbiont]|uniref:ATP-binding protein n=1 Tax=Olavius algarvensis spirochete endosymbiont TaxID=260710 RepID=UPI000F16F9FC|nr:ATP-binding protein [Olavius algarvensis spirochete endosymbiont]CAD7840477.1 MAG: hypothetical protein [Olavius algarvensis spirochete endosymbiont]VDB00460.1 hypothetical protein S1OALGB6SA_1542 [Olavius algarvensis spirochete endosymbiont]